MNHKFFNKKNYLLVFIFLVVLLSGYFYQFSSQPNEVVQRKPDFFSYPLEKSQIFKKSRQALSIEYTTQKMGATLWKIEATPMNYLTDELEFEWHLKEGLSHRSGLLSGQWSPGEKIILEVDITDLNKHFLALSVRHRSPPIMGNVQVISFIDSTSQQLFGLNQKIQRKNKLEDFSSKEEFIQHQLKENNKNFKLRQ